MPIFTNLKVPPSLKEIAFQSIKEAILSKRLKPGKVYNEQGISKELGISKTPVREALIDLSTKGFLTFLPRRGIRINTLTEKDIRDLYEFRSVLETAIIRRITLDITEESIKKIETIHNKGKEAIKNNNSMKYVKINREFHMFPAILTENQFMISELENIYDLIDWMASKALLRKKLMVEFDNQHKKIVQTLKNRDMKGAQVIIEEHIRFTEKIVLEEFYKSQGLS